MEQDLFLATTSLENFWDKNSNNGVFLGEWCKLYSERRSYENLNWNTLEYIWKDEKEIDEGIMYCESVYQNILKKLYIALNTFHNINKDLRYWDVLLKPWLLPYIQIIHDKYRHIKLAEKKYNNIYTFTLCNNEYSFVNTPNMFLQNVVNNDIYNLQLYSQIIKFLNIKSDDIKYKYEKNNLIITYKFSKKENFLRIISKIANKIANKNSVLVVSPYFKENSLLKVMLLSLNSRFLFVFDNLAYDIKVDKKIDLLKRKTIFNKILFDDEFSNLVFETLVYNFPSIYLEGFLDFRGKVLKLPIKKSKVIYSANAMHGNEIFKFYTAENYRELVITYGQHGGNIGLDKVNIPEEIEMNFSDIYFTFGWGRANGKIIYQPTYSSKSIDFMKYENIVLVMTVMPRYFYRYMYCEESSKIVDYIENTKVFLQNFNLKERLVIRPYMQDYQWSIKDRLLEVSKDLKFDNHTNYYKQIKNARIVIFDHMHTGYLETLSVNIPTVIIIPQNIYYFRESAKPYIQLLKDANILFENPLEAAEFVEIVYSNVASWWQSDNVQNAREEFCYRYARTSENWADEWIKEFNTILEENARNNS
ncbi:LIC12162 family transferase [Aliarcobacter sp. ERUVET-7]|uniref:LIC12162 family transferase n=1 Tax=Aliarcobacter sp. ERUVET-7 TaxID=3429683 RepID=UPI003D6BA136